MTPPKRPIRAISLGVLALMMLSLLTLLVISQGTTDKYIFTSLELPFSDSSYSLSAHAGWIRIIQITQFSPRPAAWIGRSGGLHQWNYWALRYFRLETEGPRSYVTAGGSAPPSRWLSLRGLEMPLWLLMTLNAIALAATYYFTKTHRAKFQGFEVNRSTASAASNDYHAEC